MNDKIAKEVAEQEFERFADMMDLDLDPDDMDEDDRRGFEKQKDPVIRAIQTGALVINDDGEPVFTPQRTKDVEPLTFHEPTGASLMAMDRKKKTEDVAKLFVTMADMTKTHANVFSKMKMNDLNVCTAITMLFMG